MGPICCLETSVRKYHYSLRNNPKQSISQVLRGVNLKISQLHKNVYSTEWLVSHLTFET